MDRKLPQKPEIERLILIAESSRNILSNDARAIAQRLNVVSRARTSLKTHPKRWLLGGIASGFITSMIFRRRSTTPPTPTPTQTTKNRSLTLTLLGLTLTAIRPIAKVWLTEQLSNYLTGRSSALQPRNFRTPSPSPKSF
jgi:hypothetical protein